MGELGQEFLKQTISKLKRFQSESIGKNWYSEELLRRFFRQLHTLKGTSNTFNFIHLAHLAHEIETLLQAVQSKQIIQSVESQILFEEGVKQLLQLAADYQADRQTHYPQQFSDKIKALVTVSNHPPVVDFWAAKIPQNIWSQLAAPEKSNLRTSIQSGNNLYLLQVFFNLATFYEDFKQFKQLLIESGEVIAVSPVQSETVQTEIGFQTLFVSQLPTGEVEKLVRNFAAKVEFEISFTEKKYPDNVGGVMASLSDAGQTIANRLDKKISFEFTHDDFEVSMQDLILLKEIASHLLGNAVDHAIETADERLLRGKPPVAAIRIAVKKADNNLLLEIEDDGRGLEAAKITERAKAAGIIPLDKQLDEIEALELIFQPGFSTSQTVSEISGRGVGLDAVRDLVERSGGKIEVQTEPGRGTIFRISWPTNL